VQIQLSMNAQGDALVLNVLNKSEDEESFELDLSAFSIPDGEYRGYIMRANSLTATNMPGQEQISEYEDTVSVEDKTVKSTIKKLSFAEYELVLTAAALLTLRALRRKEET
jgi:hypothetical protein